MFEKKILKNAAYDHENRGKRNKGEISKKEHNIVTNGRIVWGEIEFRILKQFVALFLGEGAVLPLPHIVLPL
jgi:hypothetical protein